MDDEVILKIYSIVIFFLENHNVESFRSQMGENKHGCNRLRGFIELDRIDASFFCHRINNSMLLLSHSQS